MFRRLEERVVYETRFIRLYDDRVILNDGTPSTHVRLAYRASDRGAVIIPRLPDRRLLLLRVHRYAVEAETLEFPRGGAKPGEAFADVADRELRSEVGLQATSLEMLGEHWPDGAILTTRVGVFLASLAEDAERQVRLTPKEAIQSAAFYRSDELRVLVREGQIRDGFTLGALALLEASAR
jgi:ADP-ribose pyrophosphatase